MGWKISSPATPSPVQLPPPFRSLGACRYSIGSAIISPRRSCYLRLVDSGSPSEENALRVSRVFRVFRRNQCLDTRKKKKKNSNFLSRRSHIMISQSVPFGTEGAAPIPTAGRQSQCHLEHFSQVGRSHLKSGCGRRERQAQAADWPHYPAPSRSLPRKRGEREWGGERGGVRWKCERRDACPTRPGLVPFFVLF